MKVLVIFVSLFCAAFGGIITHEGEVEHHEKATSYQSIHIEHFHPVPTYIKKEDLKFLEHPIPIGKTSSKIEIHHGGKHDPGYAIRHEEDGAGFHHFGAGFDEFAQQGHKVEAQQGYEVHDQGQEVQYQHPQPQYQEAGEEEQGNLQYQNLGHEAVFNWAELQQQFGEQQEGGGLGMYQQHGHLPGYEQRQE